MKCVILLFLCCCIFLQWRESAAETTVGKSIIILSPIFLKSCPCERFILIFTGRNEVVAKVIFYTCLSFCSQQGGLPQCMLGYHPPGTRQTPPDQANPPDQAATPQTRQTCHPPPLDQAPPQDQADSPRPVRHPPDQADPSPGKQTPAYGLRAAGTHPTGMHSWLQYFSCTFY